jgi:hypothetical protein
VQRLEVLVAVMLARERRAQAVAAAGGCTALAAALAALPSGVLQMVADAVAALGPRDSVKRRRGQTAGPQIRESAAGARRRSVDC